MSSKKTSHGDTVQLASSLFTSKMYDSKLLNKKKLDKYWEHILCPHEIKLFGLYGIQHVWCKPGHQTCSPEMNSANSDAMNHFALACKTV